LVSLSLVIASVIAVTSFDNKDSSGRRIAFACPKSEQNKKNQQIHS
jgi:hypothetical protein